MGIKYIRVLKYVTSAGPRGDGTRVTVVLTLTSDLGESSYPQAVPLACTVTTSGQSVHTELLEWSGTRAVQTYQFEVPPSRPVHRESAGVVRVCARQTRTRDRHNDDDDDDQEEGEEEGGGRDRGPAFLVDFLGSHGHDLIVPVEFEHGGGRRFSQSVVRTFRVGSRDVAVRELTRESIVSHVWDGGLLMSALLASVLCLIRTPPRPRSRGPGRLEEVQAVLGETLRPGTRVTELGTGTGLVGLVTSHLPGLHITVTDLPAAEDLVLQNASTARGPSAVTFRALDWTDTGHRLDAAAVNVLMMTDVTYNESYHEALSSCIQRLSRPGTRIIFTSKYRHASERAFIDGLAGRYKVLNRTVFDGTSFHCKQVDGVVVLGDVEILVLEV
ncbi:protein of unknown function [Taphrina deformans PYCC 5710]|uniref:Uncharacterized protein n=1 Tax=Taphrina deformans (strain PYCC 5710 / ATCC 11124 / CBS 356.35 / IMI 108563 / JCM 9778 / NBRC 8474) TaxID=1097556 RepID=R4XIM5_TAPDE|nr:protein of unknown function [Taphrina deformans PYCC 5710]|eukprot:CCG84354.1 protein of unknown function [Taphrina deformans PYCC 5710]